MVLKINREYVHTLLNECFKAAGYQILTLQLKQMPHHLAKWSILALGFSFNNFIVLESSFIRTLSLGIVFKFLQVWYT